MKPLSRKVLKRILIFEIVFFIIMIFGTYLLKREHEIAMDKLEKNRIFRQAQEAQRFNDVFESYETNDAPMSEVRSLIAEIIAKNATESRNGTNHIVTYNGSVPKSIPKYSSKKTYKIKLEKDENTGYVINCVVIPNE